MGAERVVPLGRRWQPGQSGNPSGRRAGLAALVRRSTRDGRELVRFLLAVVRDANTKPRERLEATRMLLERGWGRSPAVADPLLVAEAKEAAEEQGRVSLEAVRAILASVDHGEAPKVYDY
jgi:hypothetical protein